MLYKGYHYRKLETITLQWNMLDNLCLLKNLPALVEFTYTHPEDFDLETMPTNLVHLRKLKVTNYSLRNLSHLHNFSALQEIDLSGNRPNWVTKLETIPTCLTFLVKLILRSCNVRDLSFLRRFPSLKELDVS